MTKQYRRIFTVSWAVLACVLAIAVLVFTFRGLDGGEFLQVLKRSNGIWLAVLILILPTEQWVRSWKWRQILFDIRPVSSWRLFAAVMAGYFANMVVPVGISPLVRAWLVAKKEALKISTVLLTTAIERFVDGVVFAIIVGLLVAVYNPPDVEGNLLNGLAVVGGGSFILFVGLLILFKYAKPNLQRQQSGLGGLLIKLETRFSKQLTGLTVGIAEGIAWPRDPLRGVGVVVASLVMKLISATHFLWAGLAFGITLAVFDYLFIMIFAGFSMIITRFIRIPGGGVMGSAIALRMLGVPDEHVLAMVALVYGVSVATTVLVGAPALWYGGLKISSLNKMK